MAADTDQERYAALQWAATFRGVTDTDEALDWMAQRGLVEYEEGTGTVKLTAEGIERGDALYDALNRVPDGTQNRRRSTLLALAALGFVLWRRRR